MDSGPAEALRSKVALRGYQMGLLETQESEYI